MKHRPLRTALWAALIGSTCLTVSTPSQACTPEPYIAAVCILAVPWTNLNGYAPANGALMPINTNQALFSLIGTTYGGDGRTNFQLPDLQGRVVIGAGTGAGLPTYPPGAKSGSVSVTLTAANVPLPPHSHALDQSAVVTTGVGTLTASTSMSAVSASASASGLSLKGFSGTGGLGTASGNALATPSGPPNKIYANSAPDVTMMAGSIAGTAPVTFTGNPSTTLTGSPSVTLSGSTAMAGAGASAPVNIMQPYLAMNYFIAVNGIYPSRN